MRFYDKEGNEVDLTVFEAGVVIARITKPMTQDEFSKFCKNNSALSEQFHKRGITLAFCPDWVEFKEWK